MSGILSLGKGRLSGACAIGDDNVIVLRRGGALRKKRLLSGRKIIDDGIIGYSKDCYIFPIGRLDIDTEVKYEANNQ